MGWQGADVARTQRAESRLRRCVDELADSARARRERPTTSADERLSRAIDEYDEARRALDTL